MHFLPDRRLYTDTDYCLSYLRDFGSGADPAALDALPLHFHWRGAVSAKQALCLKSVLATQDLAATPCSLWLEDPRAIDSAAGNPYLAPFLPYITLRRFDLGRETQGTPFERQDWVAAERQPPALSDIIRLVLLYRYGGCYSDMDAIFLRDLRVLFRHVPQTDFCFQWSYLRCGTNAFCRMTAGGPAVTSLMERACAAKCTHPRRILDMEHGDAGLLVLPFAFFSPLWLHYDHKDRCAAAPFANWEHFFRRFGWFFRPDARAQSFRRFFEGAFTYHWHGCWNAEEWRQSYAGRFDAELNAVLRVRYGDAMTFSVYGR